MQKCKEISWDKRGQKRIRNQKVNQCKPQEMKEEEEEECFSKKKKEKTK